MSGVFLALAGVLVNPWLLGRVFAPDGTLDGERRIALVVLFEIFCLLSAAAVLWTGGRRRLPRNVQHPAALSGLVLALSCTVVGTGWGIWAYRSAHHHTTTASGQPLTDTERAWADEFVRRSLDAAQRRGWFDFDRAMADGFRLQWDDREHYFNRDYLFDDRILDPERPEFLMYQDTPRGKLLVGYMFFTRALEERGPTPGGSLAPWHFHEWGRRGYCAERGLLPLGRPDDDGRCATGVHVTRSAEMLHVWFVDHPLGPYADAMVFPGGAGAWDLTLMHPMAVHFTIALFFVAVALDLVGSLARKESLHVAAFVNLLLAGLFGAATIAAGMLAEVRLLINHDVHQVLDVHKWLGFSTFGGIVALLVWRVAHRGALPGRRSIAVLYLASSLSVAGLAAAAGHVGAELVYVHGVGVQAIDRLALERLERSVRGSQPAAVPASQEHEHAQR